MDVLTITYNFGSTTQYNMNRKTIRFILAVSAEHRRYNNTLYNIFFYIQICGVRTKTALSDSLHRILSEQRPEKTCRKKTSVWKKTRQEIWVGSMATWLEGLRPYLQNKYSNKGRQTLNNLRSANKLRNPWKNRTATSKSNIY